MHTCIFFYGHIHMYQCVCACNKPTEHFSIVQVTPSTPHCCFRWWCTCTTTRATWRRGWRKQCSASCTGTTLAPTSSRVSCTRRWASSGTAPLTTLSSAQRSVENSFFVCLCISIYRLVGLVLRRPPQERKVPGSNPACAGIFSGSSHTSDLNIGTPVATLPGA